MVLGGRADKMIDGCRVDSCLVSVIKLSIVFSRKRIQANHLNR